VVADPTGVLTEPHPEDMEEIAAIVRNAESLSDYTVVSIHAHEGDGDRSVPARFVVDFARRMIDEGADVFVGHGPHVLRGIEIYKGKPILYSLGDFIFQNETLQRLPNENYAPLGLGDDKGLSDFNDARYDHDRTGFPASPEIWESVVAEAVFQAEELSELKLHPISLGFGKPRYVRGRPLAANEQLSRKIISDLTRLSKPFGTDVQYVDGVGVVKLKAPATN
jgi:poly-gamma-glutamate synthesis protein (capsule biosynthesis protein)